VAINPADKSLIVVIETSPSDAASDTPANGTGVRGSFKTWPPNATFSIKMFFLNWFLTCSNRWAHLAERPSLTPWLNLTDGRCVQERARIQGGHGFTNSAALVIAERAVSRGVDTE
jgi:hypothetical protein